jgi:hypothetical protein
MASEAVINVPFAKAMLSVVALGPRDGPVQARDLLTHPVVEQLQERFLEPHRAATKAAQNCSICCHRMLLGFLAQAKVSRPCVDKRLSRSRHGYPDRELFHRGDDNT